MTVDEAFGFVDAEEWKRIPFEPGVLSFAHQVDDKDDDDDDDEIE